MEVFDLARRGTAKVFSTKKMNVLVVTMIYPAVLSYCYQNFDTEGAIEALRKLGSNIMDDFLNIYNLKRNKFQDYIKDFFDIFYSSKVKIKKITEDIYHVIDDDCILCTDIKLEGLPFHYCTPYSGSIERLLTVLTEREKLELPRNTFEVKTISSRGTGDKACIHSIQFKGA